MNFVLFCLWNAAIIKVIEQKKQIFWSGQNIGKKDEVLNEKICGNVFDCIHDSFHGQCDRICSRSWRSRADSGLSDRRFCFRWDRSVGCIDSNVSIWLGSGGSAERKGISTAAGTGKLWDIRWSGLPFFGRWAGTKQQQRDDKLAEV